MTEELARLILVNAGGVGGNGVMEPGVQVPGPREEVSAAPGWGCT